MQLKDESCDNYYYSPNERVIHNGTQGNFDRLLDRKGQKHFIWYYAGIGCHLSYGNCGNFY
jgi:hypothetical protein